MAAEWWGIWYWSVIILVETGRQAGHLSSSKDIPKGLLGDSAWQKARRGSWLQNSSALFVAVACLLKRTAMNLSRRAEGREGEDNFSLRCPLQLDYSGCGVFCAELEAQGSSYLVFLPSMGILPKFVYQPSVHSFQNACFIIVSAGEKQANKNNGESSRTQITGALYVGSMVREPHRSQCVLSSLYFW